MRYCIIADIHSNFEALEAVIHSGKKESVDQFLCLGDIVGYAAQPEECIDLLRQMKAVCVAGNHDWAVCRRIDPAYFNEWGKAGVRYAQSCIGSEDFEWLNQLPLVQKNEDLIMVHATLNEPMRFDYLLDISQARDTALLMDTPLCFVGHTHIAKIFIQQGHKIFCVSPDFVEIQPRVNYIVNVGSVGQPRDENPLAAYCVYDTQEETIEIKRVEYDIKQAQEKILKAGLPAFCAQRLASGQ